MDIREVASRARVSTATVSRTLNNIPTVDPRLARRVWKVVNEVGYYPNKLASGLVSGKSRVFGLIVSEITNPFFPEIVQTFENLAVENNYEILLTSTVHDPRRMELSVRRMIERRVDGVAILTFGMEDSLIQHLRFRKVPLVFVDVGPDFPGVSNIKINYQSGIRQGVQHLAALGHRQIAFITGPLNLKSAQARRSAFEKSMEEISLVPGLIVEGDHTMEGGMRLLTQLVESRIRPTAVMCSNDMTAIGVMREAYDQGINVPQDLSVIGFDDVRLAQFITPPLTTVRMSQTDLARIAFEALMSETERQAALKGRVDHELDTSLVLRRSTARAPSEIDTSAD
ncbi:MAG TPA: LacI family DNA-binding transcriptional regulator [Terriglobales bacterium]|nr:LacI family DNA-binding transcriptional regulator [Terriglobales bacterium]